jgi:hypothetical protein
MSEAETDIDAAAFQALKAHAESLERQLHEAEIQSAARLRQADLKAEAMRAGCGCWTLRFTSMPMLRWLLRSFAVTSLGCSGRGVPAARHRHHRRRR